MKELVLEPKQNLRSSPDSKIATKLQVKRRQGFKMNANEIVIKAREEFAGLGKKSADGIAGFSKTEEGWSILMEAVERKGIPDTMDVLGLYEIHLDNEGNLLGMNRKKLRKRGETQEG